MSVVVVTEERVKPYFIDPLEFAASEIVAQCRRGETSRVWELERLFRDGSVRPYDVGVTLEEVFRFARMQAIAEARELAHACRNDSIEPPNAKRLIECVETYVLDPEADVQTTSDRIRTYAFGEAEVLLTYCRGDRDVIRNAAFLEFFLEYHRFCEHIDSTNLGMGSVDIQMLRAAAVVRSMYYLERYRRTRDDRAIDALHREVRRRQLTPEDLCMTPQEVQTFFH